MIDSSVLTDREQRPFQALRMPIPNPRGKITEALLADLTDPDGACRRVASIGVDHVADVFADDDAQLALTLLYELHLRGIDGVDDELGWGPDLLRLRSDLEALQVSALDEAVGRVDDPGDVVDELFRIGGSDDGPPLARFMATKGTVEQFREIVIHRSLNQLREADLHTHAIPRIAGPAKAALVEVQSDEYGGGRLDYMHSELFAKLMRELDLNDSYAHYIDRVPAATLVALNTLSYFGMHRSRVNELVGHLCIIEMSSSLPSRDYSRALHRLGVDESARIFYDEHVEADAVHEQLIVRRVAGALGVTPADRIGLVRGARACLVVENLLTEQIWDAWEAGRSSLLPAVAR